MMKRILVFLLLLGLTTCPFRCHLGLAVDADGGGVLCAAGCCSSSGGGGSQGPQGSSQQPADHQLPADRQQPVDQLPTTCGCFSCVCCGALIVAGSESVQLEQCHGQLAYPIDFQCFLGFQADSLASSQIAQLQSNGWPDLVSGPGLRVLLQSWQI